LVEPFDLALGLGWRESRLLPDAEDREEVLERVAAAAEPGGVDPAVVGERARRGAVNGLRSDQSCLVEDPTDHRGRENPHLLLF